MSLIRENDGQTISQQQHPPCRIEQLRTILTHLALVSGHTASYTHDDGHGDDEDDDDTDDDDDDDDDGDDDDDNDDDDDDSDDDDDNDDDGNTRMSRTHVKDPVVYMSEVGGLRKHEQTQHALCRQEDKCTYVE